MDSLIPLRWAVAIIIGCILAVGYVDKQVADMAELAAIEEQVTAVCEVRGYEPVRDKDGVLVCPDSGPSWAMARPIGRM